MGGCVRDISLTLQLVSMEISSRSPMQESGASAKFGSRHQPLFANIFVAAHGAPWDCSSSCALFAVVSRS